MLPVLLLALQAVLHVQTELVVVPVSVTDARGRHVSGLGQEHFRVLEDGQPRPIALFHYGAGPITLGLIVDRSQSMRHKTVALAAAVSSLLHTIRAGDEVFAVAFHDRATVLPAGEHAFTSDPALIETAITAVPPGGRTALYDGVAAGLEHLRRGRGEKKVLIVLSDGADNASRFRAAEILALARQSNTVVYAIGLTALTGESGEDDAGLLKRLCRDTGGVAHFPRSAAETIAASAHITRDLREQYTLGFTPGGAGHGRAVRRIEVSVGVAGQRGLKVRTRSSYSAASP